MGKGIFIVLNNHRWKDVSQKVISSQYKNTTQTFSGMDSNDTGG